MKRPSLRSVLGFAVSTSLSLALAGRGGSAAAVKGIYVHDLTGARIELDTGKANFQVLGCARKAPTR